MRFKLGAREFILLRLFVSWFWGLAGALVLLTLFMLFLVALFLNGVVRKVAERVCQVVQRERIRTESNIGCIKDICVKRIP